MLLSLRSISFAIPFELALLILPTPFAPSHMLFRAPTEILYVMSLPRDDTLLCREATSSPSSRSSPFFNNVPSTNETETLTKMPNLKSASVKPITLSCLVA